MARESEHEKQHFVPGEDRPEVKIDLEKPIRDLRVRDLLEILGGLRPQKTFLMDKDMIKGEKPEIIEKHLISKLEKPEKLEKHEKLEKLEKIEKHEKIEKPEKLEKLELEPPQKHFIPEPPKVASREQLDPGIDPRVLPEILKSFQGVLERLDKLANQLADLQKRVK